MFVEFAKDLLRAVEESIPRRQDQGLRNVETVLRETFQGLAEDEDEDSLRAKEFERGLQILGMKPCKDELDEIMDLFSVDATRDRIRHQDFVTGVCELGTSREENVIASLREIIGHAKAQRIPYEEWFEKYDDEGNGWIGFLEFSRAVSSLGMNVPAEVLRQVCEEYMNEENQVAYVRFLKELESEEGRNTTSGFETITRDDIMDRLRSFARAFCAGRSEHDLWALFEAHDREMKGVIAVDDVERVMGMLGLDLSNADKRRLVMRFGLRQGKLIRYRDLIVHMLRTRESRKEILKRRKRQQELDDHPETNELEQNEDDERTEDNPSGIQNVFKQNDVLEHVSDDELSDVLWQMKARCEEMNIDIRDVFEQFDLNYTGFMQREDFLQCCRWIGIKGTTFDKPNANGLVADEFIHNRFANRFTIDDSRVAYKAVLKQYFATSGQLQHDGRKRSVAILSQEGMDLIETVREKVEHLHFSGVDFEEAFRHHDENSTGLISLHDFHRVLLSMGVKVTITRLPRLIERFEVPQTQGGRTGMIRYAEFCGIVRGSNHRNDEDQQRTGISASMDKFEICKLLRDRTSQAFEMEVQRTSKSNNREDDGENWGMDHEDRMRFQILKRCFEDMDSDGDGVVDHGELLEALQLLGVLIEDESEINRVASAYSLQRNGPKPPREVAKIVSGIHELTLQGFLHILGESHLLHFPPSQAESDDYLLLLQDGNDSKVDNEYALARLKELSDTNASNDLFLEFEKYDTNWSGIIDEADMCQALRDGLGLKLKESQGHRLFRRLGLVVASDSLCCAGVARVKYRLLLHKIALPYPLDGTEDEILLETLRENSAKVLNWPSFFKRGARCEAIKAINMILSQSAQGKHVLNTSEAAISRLVRVLEDTSTPDLCIRVSELVGSLTLCVDSKTVHALRLLCSDHKDLLMQRFEVLDSDFCGHVPEADFSAIMLRKHDGFGEWTNHVLTQADIDVIAKRFQQSIVNPDLSPRRVDYRAMLRYFSIASSSALNTAEPNPALCNEHISTQGLGLNENDPGDNKDKQWWEYLWKETSARDGRQKREFTKWKMRKDWYEATCRAVWKLDKGRGEVQESWCGVGVALACMDQLLLIQAAGTPALEKVFIAWSKATHEFHDVDLNRYPWIQQESGDDPLLPCLKFKNGGPLSKRDRAYNKLFLQECKSTWSSCLKKAKRRYIVHKLETNSSSRAWRVLLRCGLEKLEDMLEEDKIRLEENDRAAREEAKRSADRTHHSFLKRKDRLKVRIPRAFEKPDSDDFPTSSLNVEYAMDVRYVHATNETDLQRCRDRLIESGYVHKENFTDRDGQVMVDEYVRMKQKIGSESRKTSRLLRKCGADHQFSLWKAQKAAREQASLFLRYIEAPDLISEGDDERFRHWKQVGKALKLVDRKGLFVEFAEWSKGYVDHSKCLSAWHLFPPRTINASDADGFKWAHLRRILGKIISTRTGSDFTQAFECVVNKHARDHKVDVAQARADMLRSTEVKYFREMLGHPRIGFANGLRLHEEKRLVHSYPGLDREGKIVPDAISMRSFLSFTSDEESETDDTHQGLRSIEEKIHRALVVAGAPSSVAQAWEYQSNDLQRGLLFLAARSRENRLKRKSMKREKQNAKPPLQPTLTQTYFSTTSIGLEWKRHAEETREILFFALERVSKDKKQGGFTQICRDPPRQTDPPQQPKGGITISNLAPNTCYEFRLTAFNRFGPSPPVRTWFFTLPDAAPRPKVVKLKCEGQLAGCTLFWGTAFNETPPVVPVKEHHDSSPRHIGSAGTGQVILQTSRTRYELLQVRSKLDGMWTLGDSRSEEDPQGVPHVLYFGEDTTVDVIGMKPGRSYSFFVRCINGSGRPGPPSPVCTVNAPMNPPNPPAIAKAEKASEIVLKWDPYDGVGDKRANNHSVGKEDDVIKGVLADWAETIRRWESDGQGSYEMSYSLKYQQEDDLKRKGFVRNLSDTCCALQQLKPNSKYRVCLRIESRVKKQGFHTTFKSAWSKPLQVCTAPTSCTQPVVVHLSELEAILRWSPPESRAATYRVEMQARNVEDENEQQKGWTCVYHGKQNISSISDLRQSYVYSVRVIALSETGVPSEPSLPARVVPVSSQRVFKGLTPLNAGKHFTIPCETFHALTLGDMILFTEKVPKAAILRTIAGRIIARKKSAFWLQVEWCSLDGKGKHGKLPKGARLQRSQVEIFALETSFGVYRTPWHEESARTEE